MRGLWTPVRVGLTRSPKLREIARALRCDTNAALGRAVRWLAEGAAARAPRKKIRNNSN